MYFDTHNHIHDDRLSQYFHSTSQLIDGCHAAGITRMVVNSTSPDDWSVVLGLAKRHPDTIIPALGIHPWNLQHTEPNTQPTWSTSWKDALLEHTEGEHRETTPICIGECGLDRWVNNPNKLAQRDAFIFQLSIAARFNLPISIHCLRAWGELLDILTSQPLPQRGVHIHSFAGSLETARELVKLGAYFSFSGYFLHERKANVCEIYRKIPISRILVESDAPDMLPPPAYQVNPSASAEMNSPLNLPMIIKGLGQHLHLPTDELTHHLFKNSIQYFTKK